MIKKIIKSASSKNQSPHWHCDVCNANKFQFPFQQRAALNQPCQPATPVLVRYFFPPSSLFCLSLCDTWHLQVSTRHSKVATSIWSPSPRASCHIIPFSPLALPLYLYDVCAFTMRHSGTATPAGYPIGRGIFRAGAWRASQLHVAIVQDKTLQSSFYLLGEHVIGPRFSHAPPPPKTTQKLKGWKTV